MRGAEQAGFIRIAAYQLEIDVDLVGLQQQARPAHGQFADAAAAEATANDEAFGVAPALEAQEASNDERELLRKLLDGALHDPRRFGFAVRQQGRELLLADLLARLVAERILLIAQRFAPLVEDFPECVPVGFVAQEALVVLDFQIVAVDLDAGENRGAVGRKLGLLVFGICHPLSAWSLN